MAFKLPSQIDSPQLLEAVRFEVERLQSWLSDSEVKGKVGVGAAAEPSRSSETQTVLDAWLGDKTAKAADLAALGQTLAELKPVTVHLTLAALPGESLRQPLVEWFRTHCRDDVLVSFGADRTIGGGIVVRTPNHIFDYSFRQRLIDGRKKIPELIRRVG